MEMGSTRMTTTVMIVTVMSVTTVEADQNHPRDLGPGTLSFVGFCGGPGSGGFVMSKVLYGTNKPAPVQGSRDTGI